MPASTSERLPGLEGSFNPHNVPFLREAIRSRAKRRSKDVYKAEEAVHVRELMPILAEQVRCLIEESEKVTEQEYPNFFHESINYAFRYEVPTEENEEPLGIVLRSQFDRIDRGVSDYGFSGLRLFDIEPPGENDSYLSVLSIRQSPELVSRWKREKHTDRPIRRDAKAKHIRRYTSLVQGLRQGIASGEVRVYPVHNY